MAILLPLASHDQFYTMNKKAEKEETEELTQESTPDIETQAEGQETHEYGEAESIDPVLGLQRQLEEEQSKYLRLYAEFENFRRRNPKERIELISSASSELMKGVLPVLDDFERAVESNKKITDIEAIKEGFILLQQKLSNILEAKGLQRVKSKGEAFDAEIHEAIAQVPVDDNKLKGKIIEDIEPGYTLNDKVLRHPKVVVGS